MNMHYCKYALLRIHIIVTQTLINKYKRHLLGIINIQNQGMTHSSCKLNLTGINRFCNKNDIFLMSWIKTIKILNQKLVINQ